MKGLEVGEGGGAGAKRCIRGEIVDSCVHAIKSDSLLKQHETPGVFQQ